MNQKVVRELEEEGDLGAAMGRGRRQGWWSESEREIYFLYPYNKQLGVIHKYLKSHWSQI